VPRALRLDPSAPDPIAAHLLMLEEAFSRAHEFDVIHAHVDYLAFPFARRVRCPVVTTLHGRLDLPSLVPVFREYLEQRVISISDHQRRPLPDARWQATIHHAAADLYRFRAGRDGYLAFLTHLARETVDRAIEIAAAPAARCASPPRSTRPTAPTTSARSARSSTIRWSTTWASSATARRTTSWATPPRCCSRSTGPSRSG
jgi:hypothetical protein